MRSHMIRSLAVAFVFGCLFWIVDGVYEYYRFGDNLRFMLFQEPLTFLDSLVLNIPPHSLLNRCAFMTACLAGGTLVGLVFGKYRQRDRALKRSERRFRRIFERHSAIMYAVDPETLEIVAANQAAEDFYGFGPGELTKKRVLDINTAEESELRAVIVQVLDDKRSSFEFEHRVADGTTRDVEVRLAPIEMEDDRVRLFSIVTDITERKESERERRFLEAQVQMAQKLESLGVLAGGIAHDFNNLLMAILGNVDLALMDLPESDPARTSIREVETAAKRAADLCRQMLAYSGRGSLEAEPLSINRVVQEMGRLLEVSVTKQATIRYALQPDLPLIHADATQVRQVVMNLMTNASEAIVDGGGIISLSTGALECSEAYLRENWVVDDLPAGRYVCLEVSDTGSGMDETTLSRVFEPFYTTKFTGRGLGLAAVLGIVRGHKGAVKVSSLPGRGTTFRLLFPTLEDSCETADEAADPEDDWKGSGTILVVDDEDRVLTLAERMLRRMGFEVMAARDGEEAIQVFRRNRDSIDCVLLDLTMPRVDGEKAYHALREIRPDIRVILCSGYGEQELARRFDGTGVDGLIQKPYQSRDLRGALRRVLGTR